MRIQVTRSGGFAGIERHAEIDTDALPDADRWHALASSVLASGAQDPSAGVPDGFSYEITVDGRTVRCVEPRLTDEQRQLVSGVLKEGA
jgi:hypothetical protein